MANKLAIIDAGYGSFDRLRDMRADCGAIGQTAVSRLPGTLVEINQISNFWTEADLGPFWKFSGSEASEENFKLHAPGKRVVHIATHGYFASPCTGDNLGSNHDLYNELIDENPLLQSGLFFRGVNIRSSRTGRYQSEDGVLTAEEVCSMNFSGTQWVVLSACGSGRGVVRYGEGVFGLRRSFQLAGAQTIISSLWPVNDAVTETMMGQLYRSSKKNVGEAMREVMINKLNDLRRRSQPDHPVLWAPFISVGNWTTVVREQ
jgi:CHAT domain-containing protein